MTKLLLPILVIAVVGAILVCSQLYRKRQNKRRREYNSDMCSQIVMSSETIFVSVPSYRDSECPKTLFSLFSKASCPQRVFVGVCQQNYSGDVDALERYERLCSINQEECFSDNIRVFSMNASDARGPMLARHLIEKHLYRNEAFYLMIDSHTHFVDDWDTKFVQQWKQCNDPKAILTMYPDNYVPYKHKDKHNQPAAFLRFKQFNPKTGVVEIEGPPMQLIPPKPQPTLFWAACCSFASASMLKEVPFDPYCDFVFLGEEISMAARLWTHGYNFYSPCTMLLYHIWSRDYRPTFWEQLSDRTRRELETKGYNRILHLLGLVATDNIEFGKYGLGTMRSLQEFEEFIGIDMKQQQASNRSRQGLTKMASSEEIMCKHGIKRPNEF